MQRVWVLASWAAVLLTTTSLSASEGPGGRKSPVVVKEYELFREFVEYFDEPIFKREGDVVLMNFLNPDQNAILIRLINSEGKMVFEEKLSGETVISKSFNFEDSFRGEYTIVIYDGYERFEKKVSIL